MDDEKVVPTEQGKPATQLSEEDLSQVVGGGTDQKAAQSTQTKDKVEYLKVTLENTM
jgi:bacteriocin-like protein